MHKVFYEHEKLLKCVLIYLILMEMVLEGTILQMMATLLKLLPMDVMKHFCTYYSYWVNLIQDYMLLLYPRLKNNDNNDT